MIRTLATLALVAALGATGPGADRSGASPTFDVVVRGSGRPLILIPGLSTSGAVWDSTVAHLGERYETHVLTLAGFGGPAPIGEPFLPRIIDAVARYAAGLPSGRPVIVGHSLGAFVAFGVAAKRPDAVAGVLAVDGVPFLGALSNPAATPGAMAPQAAQIKAMYATMTREQFAMQTRMALGGMITAPEDVERAVAWTTAADPAAAGVAVAEMMTTDLRGDVARITAPVRLIGALGAAPDAMHPAMRDAYRAQVARIPGATVVFAEAARHFVMLDAPLLMFAELDALLKEASWTR